MATIESSSVVAIAGLGNNQASNAATAAAQVQRRARSIRLVAIDTSFEQLIYLMSEPTEAR